MTNLAHQLLDNLTRYEAVDTACHLGQWPHRLSMSASESDLHAYATKHNLSAVWVSHLAALFGFDTRTGNEDCLRRCRESARLRPMAVINPLEDGWDEELAWAVESGFLGIRIAPGFHGYGAAQMVEVARKCVPTGTLLHVLLRLDDERVRHPHSSAHDVAVADVAELIHAAPEAEMLVSGLNWVGWRQLMASFGGSAPPTLKADFWHVNGPFDVMEQLAGDAEHWVFGSGYPIQSPEPTMLQVAASQMSESAKVAILRGNADSIPSVIQHSPEYRPATVQQANAS